MIFGLFSNDPKYGNISERDPEKKLITRSFLKTEKTVTSRATCKSEPFQQKCL